MRVEVTPSELANESLPSRGGNAHLFHQQVRRDRAEFQIDREPRSAVQVGTIPEGLVFIDVSQEGVQPLNGRRLACRMQWRPPGVGHAIPRVGGDFRRDGRRYSLR